MSGAPRDHTKGIGFWDGGSHGRSSNGQSGGRPSGYPGTRVPTRVGVITRLDFPEHRVSDNQRKK